MPVMHLLNAFLLSVVLIQLLAQGALRLGLVDWPGGRKVHDGPVPRIGGIAMFAAFLLPALDLMHRRVAFEVDWVLLAGLTVLVAVGVLDDLLDLKAATKLLAQTVAVLIMIVPKSNFVGVGDLFGDGNAAPPFWALPFTVFFIVGIINAFNMLDGLDGLAGGAAAVALFWLTVVAWVAGRPELMVFVLLLLFAVLGFLVFNMRHPWRPRAVVFMGDAGSMMLGAAIAFFTVQFARGGSEAAASLPSLLWIVAIPAFDTLIIMGRRVAQGQSPLIGDRRHLHHMLLQAGLSPRRATAVVVAVCAILGGVGFAGWRVGIPASTMLVALAAPFAVHLYFVCRGWKRLRGVQEPVPLRAAPVRIEDEAA
jgi:UDP-GlcNAc:undecaprenyl-phosphate/decaprenyl-phosphate GlcNAc-1-phosphate transferase